MNDRPSDGGKVKVGRGRAFGQVPEWVILHPDLSDRAVRIYGLLARYTYGDGVTWQSKAWLAEQLRCSRTSVDNAIRELHAAGAIDVEERWAPNGRRLENDYAVHFDPPDADPSTSRAPTTGRGVTPQHAEGSTRAVPGREDVQPETPPVGPPTVDDPEALVPLRHQRIPAMVDRRPVRASEGAMALAVLDEWNRLAGQSLRAKEHVAKIIMRIREYPEATLDDHSRIIRTNLLRPWWKGSPSPAVIYGNGSVFESAIQTVIDESKPQKPRVDPTATRYGRGLTTRQILDDAGVTLTMAEILDGGLTRDA